MKLAIKPVIFRSAADQRNDCAPEAHKSGEHFAVTGVVFRPQRPMRHLRASDPK
jgi:hypothetical protein